MLLSKLFTKTSKDAAADAQSINAELLTRAGFIHKSMAGVYSFLPLGLRVLRRIEQIVREEMNAIGGQEILMSALAPREYWEKTGRWDKKVFEPLFHVPAFGEQEYALNPTHEEVVVPLVQRYVHSYRDLPFGCYQIQTKFRNELRAKSGILRGREFLMKDLYSFHADSASLDQYYEQVQGAYDRIFERLGLANRTYLTYASGGSFSPYSHEYQVLLPQGEDAIFVSVEAEKQGKRIAVNREIFDAKKTTCPVTGGREFREERASEAANIFKLGQKFSDPFSLTFTDEGGATHPIIMGCYGIGISRLMGIIAEAFADKAGLVWPLSVAPAQVLIVPLAKDDQEEPYTVAQDLYRLLSKKGIACLLDDRLKDSVGSRLNDADLLGIPTRIVVSLKSLKAGGVEVKDRASGKVEVIAKGNVIESLSVH
ncbi:MAG: His/Gly/Thr/Pro-type tRNA ligase C-terminal domain-containing protein [Candidatus Peribacteraceae bacterium]|nr:His/Gly/Thr/Pro-type tRNA ligase C-terminal domain-containing protein [Candidatus Peribacteraceae bacterium]MDD5740141.1 His/Gly/Thr/Pro-type tRNA ligase C-terminal domain-containing protein [Candidatus Peribacteraceae bacterium]